MNCRMNTQYPNITFTHEEETNDSLPFLDVLVYHKPTFSGLYLPVRWDSFVPKQYKRGLVHCLIHRAWKICSSYQ